MQQDYLALEYNRKDDYSFTQGDIFAASVYVGNTVPLETQFFMLCRVDAEDHLMLISMNEGNRLHDRYVPCDGANRVSFADIREQFDRSLYVSVVYAGKLAG